jgi:hypothetical protein
MRLNFRSEREIKYSEINVFSKYLHLRTENDSVLGNHCLKELSLVANTYDLCYPTQRGRISGQESIYMSTLYTLKNCKLIRIY